MLHYTFSCGLWIAEEDQHIVAIRHETQSDTNQTKTPLIEKCYQEIQEYLAGERKCFSIPYQLQGTPFQIKVWSEVARIPYGEVRSYRYIADAIHHPRAARAVGTACNRCPLAYLIGCHRVVSSHGIGGYGSSLDEKKKLLDLERGFI